MNKAFSAIETIASKSGNAKLNELAKFITPGPRNPLSESEMELLKTIFKVGIDPKIVLGFGKAAGETVLSRPYNKNKFDNSISEDVNHLYAFDYCLTQLLSGSTTNLIISDIADMLSGFDYNQRRWIVSSLKKDLDVGVDIKSWNKVQISDKDKIEPFEVQLASPFEDNYSVVKYKTVFYEPKLDGVRCIAFIRSSEPNPKSIDSISVTKFTRNGKPILGFDAIDEDLKYIRLHSEVDLVLDGEIIGDDYKDTMENLFTKTSGKVASLFVFDGMDMKHWKNPAMAGSLISRKAFISELFISAMTEKKLNFVKSIRFYKSDFCEFDELIVFNNEFVDEGYEGTMVKLASAYYCKKRNKDWLKFKKFHTEDLEIIGGIEGEGKYVGMLGALKVIRDGSVTEVGSGFSDQQRRDYWNDLEDIIGCSAEIKFQEVIKKTGKLRFPTFVKLRLDL